MTIGMPRIDRLPTLDRLPADERGVTIGDFLVPIRLSERLNSRVRHLALVIAGAALIALGAQVYFYVPGNPVPFTGQTFAVLVTGGALGFRRGLAAAGLYLLVGALGLPVFAEGKHGMDAVLGPSGGYRFGFVLAAAIVGRLAELGWDRHLLGSIGAMLLGSLAIYALGVPWLAYTYFDGDLRAGLETGLLPYLAWDSVKLALAAVAFPAAWWIVGRRPEDR